MPNYLSLACEKLNIGSGQVLSHALYDEAIVLVVDKGVAGCPKISLPLSDLAIIVKLKRKTPEFVVPLGISDDYITADPITQVSTIVHEPSATIGDPRTAFGLSENLPASSTATDEPFISDEFISYTSMKVTELKALAKERGIKGYQNMKKSTLISKLENS